MNLFRKYIVDRLEKLEQENNDLKKWFIQDNNRNELDKKYAFCFREMIDSLDLRIRYDNRTRCYIVFSYKKGVDRIFVIDADDIDYKTEQLIKDLLLILPVKGDLNETKM